MCILCKAESERVDFAIRELRDYSASKVCRLLDISLSNYYYRIHHPKKTNPIEETEQVVRMFWRHFGNFGRRIIHRELIKENVRISERKISRILKEQGLCSKYGRRKGKNVYTSTPINEIYIADNIYRKLTEEEKEGRILSMDFTEQIVNGRKVYTCGAINIRNKVLEGEMCDCKNNSETACAVVEMAIRDYGVPNMVMTDRGSPFVSKSFYQLLKRYGIKHSMSRPHTPADNCFIETFWKSMKTEVGKVGHLTLDEYKKVMAYYKHYYNHDRPHSTLGYCPPLKVACKGCY